MAINLYDPNTGKLLQPGQSVVNKETGQTVTQGTTYVPYVPVQTTENNPNLASISSQIQNISAQIPELTKNVNAITSTNLNQSNPVTLPTQTQTKIPATTPIPDLSGLPDYLQAFINTTSPPPSTAESYNKANTESGITSAQQTVASNQNIVTQDQAQLQGIQSQLQAIQANGLAAQQTLESQAGGKDVTSSFLGAQQQEISRQTAIQSLPLQSQALAVQAKITSDQGNLTYSQDLLNQATDKLNTLYKIYSDDATNTYNYKQNLINVVYDYASKQEQAALDAQKTAVSQAFTTQQNNLNYAQSIANTAIANGQSSIAAQLMKLDPTSPTYMNDVSNLAGQVKPKPTTQNTPTSYDEWVLAGGEAGTGKTYGQYITSTKAPTQAEQTVAEYAARLEQAEPTLDSLTDKISKMNPLLFEAQLKLPSWAESTEIQQYKQAASNFVNAKLRRESGAVISPTEFTEARSQYLPVAGDSQEVLDQKKANRDLVLASLKKAAGNAYSSVSDLLGTSSGTTYQSSSGNKYNLPY